MLAVACCVAPAFASLSPLAAHAGATVAVVTQSQWGPDDTPSHYYHWVGEVANTGDTTSKPYNATDIRVTATNAAGDALDPVDAEATTLAPGERSPFDIPMATRCVGCRLSVNFAPTADPPNHKFSISPITVDTDQDGTQHLAGTVTNDNTTTADYIKVILTLYDGPNGTGTVVDEDHLPLNNSPTSTLIAGGSAPFEAIRSKDNPAYASVKVFAESLTAPSLPIVTPSPLPFDIGGVHVGSTGSKVMTITNSGNDDLHITDLSLSGTNVSEFALVDGEDSCTNVTVTPTHTCTIEISLTPTAIGSRTAVLNVTDDAADNRQAIPLQGTGQAPDISAGNLNFGDVVKTRSAQKSVVVTNVGNADLHVDADNTGVPAGTDFSLAAGGCASAVPAGQSCSLTITFAPTVTGPESTTLTITAVASDYAFHSPKQVTISGTGTNPTLGVAPTQLDFGTRTIGSPSAGKTVTVSNTGTGNMRVTGAAVENHPTDYAISGCSGSASTVAAGSSCTLTVVFTPQAAGNRGDTLTVSTDALNSPKQVSLIGRGAGAAATLDKTSLDFGRVNIGRSSSAQTVTLTNTGDQDLTITAIDTSVDYSQTNDCGTLPATLHVNASCHADVTFSPTAEGARPGTLRFTDNSTTSSHQDVSLTGTGVSQSTGWQFLGGSLASSPAATSWGFNRLDVFAKGQDAALYHMWYDGQWHPWERLGGSLTSDPAAVSWGVNRIDVFAKGRDLALYHMWTTNGGSTWEPWVRLGGTLASSPTASTWGTDRLDVFAAGQDKALYHMSSIDGGAHWLPWERLGGTLSSDPAAVSWGPTRIDVFARGQDLALYHMSSPNGTTFSSWLFLGGKLASDPVASSWGPGRLDVFAAGQDKALYHMSSDDGTTFTSWQYLGGKLSSNPAAASPEEGRIDLFARGQDLALYHMILRII